jgi:hypothetical protein
MLRSAKKSFIFKARRFGLGFDGEINRFGALLIDDCEKPFGRQSR